MMHKIILQIFKNRNSHGLLNSKHMDTPLTTISMWTMLRSINLWGVC
jgi:hypothetical protein